MPRPITEIELYERLRKRRRRLFPSQPEAENALPAVDFDFTPLFDKIIPEDTAAIPGHKRRNYVNHVQQLRYYSRGRPEITALHMLFISYLRRKTPHTKQAKILFMRLWSESANELAPLLTPRELVSALRTFSDHGETDVQKLSARTAFMYAHMIKLYESERSFNGQKPDETDWSVPTGRTPALGVTNLWGMNFGGDNSFELVHILLLDNLELDPIIGIITMHLMMAIQAGSTIFSRFDQARIKAGFELNEDRYWSFGFNPAD